MDGLALYGAIAGSVSLVWQIGTQVHARKPDVVVNGFHKSVTGPGINEHTTFHDYLVVRFVNRGQRDVTITAYWYGPQEAKSAEIVEWQAIDPTVTLAANGGTHDIAISEMVLHDILGMQPFEKPAAVAVLLSTGEVFRGTYEVFP